ncbi:MAG TPA: DNA mismatch repair endonuclease MutL [Candidatus Binatia bacterium]
MKIKVLSNELASRIAAGEVVERPASAVKELIENSLDAGASEIFVSVEKSGTALIRVVDNGEGMDAEDLEIAVERHATSKLSLEPDLFRIATLGFRGEALPSIASVSRMEIASRAKDATTAHSLCCEGGSRKELRPTAAAPGTTVIVRDIFFNVPARRKFLKSPATELSHICDVINRIALAYPAVHFHLAHDQRTIADYAGVGQAGDRLQQVWGRELVKDIAPFYWREREVSVHGFLSAAPASFPNLRYVYTYVNRRYVRDKVLTHAVLQGYENLLMKGKYPAVVLFLDLPFEDVDVNVHPAKYEVRFRRQGEVHTAVASAVRDALKQAAKEPVVRTSFTRPAEPFQGVSEAALPYRIESSAPQSFAHPSDNNFIIPPTTTEHDGFFSALQILGQILGCYIVCTSAQGLVLIDQHAAHERVAFERLRRQLATGQVSAQALLLPQTLELNAGEISLVEANLETLRSFGFVLEPFGPSAYAIREAPALLPEGDYTQLLRQMVADLAEVDTSTKLRMHLEERLATIACHNVIRANRALELEEIEALLRDLDHIDFATQCPHGRPVLVEISREELERMFKRIV